MGTVVPLRRYLASLVCKEEEELYADLYCESHRQKTDNAGGLWDQRHRMFLMLILMEDTETASLTRPYPLPALSHVSTESL